MEIPIPIPSQHLYQVLRSLHLRGVVMHTVMGFLMMLLFVLYCLETESCLKVLRLCL